MDTMKENLTNEPNRFQICRVWENSKGREVVREVFEIEKIPGFEDIEEEKLVVSLWFNRKHESFDLSLENLDNLKALRSWLNDFLDKPERGEML